MKFKLAAFADEASNKLDEQIDMMAKNNIPYLEIRGVDGENIADISLDKAKEIKNKLADNGLSVWSLGSPYGKININDDFCDHLDKFKKGLEIANELDAKHIRIFSFYIPENENADNYEDKVLERMYKFAELTKGSDIILCHENEKGIYGDTPQRCVNILKNIPSIKAVFDPANFVQCNVDIKKAWQEIAPYIEYLHIKDVDENDQMVPAGEGLGQIPYLLSQYNGKVVTLEPHLATFDGLANLEREGEASKLDNNKYSSNEESFQAAIDALKGLLINL